MARSRYLILLALLALILAGCGGEPGPSLSDRANAACGIDRIVSFKHEGSGLARRETITVTCQRTDGTLYVQVVEDR